MVSEAETEEIRDPRIVAKNNRFEMLKNNEFRFILVAVGIYSKKRVTLPFIESNVGATKIISLCGLEIFLI